MSTVRRPHVLLICIDALRYDCVNWQPQTPYFEHFGLRRNLRTPTLDAIAAQSVRFPRAVSHAGYTPLSLATTLTGTYARTHGIVDFQNTTCRPPVRALPELFKQHGYRTASICGPEWFGTLGLTRGVDRVGHDERLVLEMLREDPRAPLLAFVHLNDVHSPYGHAYWDHPAADNRDFALFMWTHFGLQFDDVTREFIDVHGRRARFDQWDQIVASPCAPQQHRERATLMFKCYLHGLEKFDQTRLRLFVEGLQAAGAWDDAIVCVFADHGEIVSPRMPWVLGHGKFLLEQLQRVPLMIKTPGIAARDVKPLVGLVDLAPTLLRLAGVGDLNVMVDYELDGRELLPAIERDAAVQNAYYQEGWSVVVAEQRALPVLYQRALRTQGDHKLLATGDALDPAAFEALDEEAFLRYAIERGLGEIAHQPTRAEFAKHLRAGCARRELADALLRQTPRLQWFDLADDPFEQRPIPIQNTAPAADALAVLAARLETLRGRPHFRAPAAMSAEEETRVLAHLGSLGYVEA